MSASAAEAQVITAQPGLNSTGSPNMNESFNNICDPEQQVKEQTRHENTMWCCMTCEECCECTECCIDCCADTVELETNNDGGSCGDCFECCADCGSD